MRVFLVAPDSGFVETSEQVQEVIHALRPEEALMGAVAGAEVMRGLRAATYDVIWFIAHGSEAGVELSDGPLSGDVLAQFLRTQAPALVYLNTCASMLVAVNLHDALRVPVICSVGQVEARAALYAGAQLAHCLAQGMDVTAAFEASRPAHDTTYRLIGGSGQRMNGNDGQIWEAIRDLQSKVARLEAQVEMVLFGHRTNGSAWQWALIVMVGLAAAGLLFVAANANLRVLP